MRIIALFLILISSNLFAQNISFEKNEHIYELDKKIRKGDFQAFLEIGNYFDSKKSVKEFLGYHIINTNESNVSKRIVRENSFFLDSEIIIDSTTTTNQFRNFLIQNQKNVVFSDLADAFIITPFEKRKTEFQIQELTESKINILESKKKEVLNLDWIKSNNIDKLIEQKNPKVLLILSSLLLKNRYRFDEYKKNNAEIVNLIRLLTKSNIAVPDETGKINFHIEEDFYEISKINLVVFFANNYKNYKWNKAKNYFENTEFYILKNNIENNLFDLLSNENDSIAINTFIQLTQSNPENVINLAEQYNKADIDFNYELPTFTYRFLKQLVFLTDYCKKKNIDYIGSKEIQNSIELLKSDLTFAERRKLEDKLISNLTLNDITAFEYWSLVYEKEWNLTYSAGRILDKFYSKNWLELIENPLYLETYLLKSKLFDDLGIIGFCNNYLVKFIGTHVHTKNYLNSLQSKEPKVNSQVEKAIEISKIEIQFHEPEKKDWYGNIDTEIKDFKKSFNKIIKESNDKEKFEDDISYLLSQINYNQIGDALNLVKSIDMDSYKLYSFMNRDFGISFIGDFEKPEVRQEFIKKYSQLDEYNLYKHYLLKSEIDFTDSNKNLDFDKIYEILKYDINTALAGGGGSTNDNGVYAVIKLLELHFKTSLGYPKKFCSSNNMYACDSRDRANSWMKYLETYQYLKMKHNKPVSFAYEK